MLMRGTTSDALLDCLDGAVGSYRPEILQQLWEAIPQGMRLSRFTRDTVPERYRHAFNAPPLDQCTGLDLSTLPPPMRREVAWCISRMAGYGGVITIQDMRMLVRRLGEVVDDLGPAAPGSLVELSARDWQHHVARAVHRRTGQLPGIGSAKTVREQLMRCYRLLWVAYDPRPWWQREVWDPTVDPRIPQRRHEPHGRQAAYFHPIALGWLRRGLQWYCKMGLETGSLTWTTVTQRVRALKVFDAFLIERGVDRPWLADEPAQVRALMLDFLGHARARRVARAGPTQGQPLSTTQVTMMLTSVEQFYAFMHEHCDIAAAALGERAWLRLGTEHARFYRHGEKPRPPQGAHERDIISDDVFTQIMAGAGLLGASVTEGGIGDEQAMRMLMLLARTGRRINEICMLDRDPLLPMDNLGADTTDSGGFVAKLRYQQTKIAGGPDTILVDQEIVTILRAQQQWADRFLAERGSSGCSPKYLFLAARLNRHGDRPYPANHLRGVLSELAGQLDIRDSTGRLVDLQRTHRFRHTKATSLLNSGVPLHVVQRYLGHLSPTMTMAYAQTLASTHEREFLRYRKVTADARDLSADPRDLYDMLELDRRTDRILPNGWCLLPPRQLCTKGNACLTCDKFATDATFLPELETQRARTDRLINERREAFRARTGQDLTDDNVWLAGRRQEQDALGRIILTLEETRLADNTVQAVRGAGATARTDKAVGEPAKQASRHAR